MNNLQQIIHTRCSPKMTIQGTPDPGEGFGIFSLSQGLLQQERDTILQGKLLSLVNSEVSERTQGPITSFSYHAPAVGEPMLTIKWLRPYNPDDQSTTRKRPGTAVTQMYIGALQDYPCRWFQEQAWDALQKSEADYYQGFSARIPFLPPVPAQPPKGGITWKQARDFVGAGRGEVLSQAMAFLLSQAKLPEQERRFLVIVAKEEEVRLWVAAIGYCLPLPTALRLSFNTRLVEFDSSGCQYNYDPSSRLAESAVSMSQPHRFFAEVVGVDPATKSTLKAARPGSLYVVLVADQMRLDPPPEPTADRPYLRAVKAFDQRLLRFTQVFSRMQPLPLSEELFTCFETLDYADKPENWDYNNLRQCFQSLLDKDAGEKELSQSLLETLANRYPAFLHQDAEKQFALLAELLRVAEYLGKQELLKDIRADVVNSLAKPSWQDENQARAMLAFANAQFPLGGNHGPMVEQLFSGQHSSGLLAALNLKREDLSAGITRLLLQHLKQVKLTFTQALSTPGLSELGQEITRQMSGIPAVARAMFTGMSEDLQQLQALVLQGHVSYPNQSQNQRQWWQMVYESEALQTAQLDGLMQQAGVAQLHEQLITQSLRSNPDQGQQTDKRIQQLILLRPGQGVGDAYYQQRMELAGKNQQELMSLIAVAHQLNLSPHVLELGLGKLDQTIPIEVLQREDLKKFMADMQAITMLRFLPNLKVNARLADYARVRKEKDLPSIRQGQAPATALADESLLESRDGMAFLQNMASLAQTPLTHVHVLTAFAMTTSRDMEKYVTAYAGQLAQNSRRNPEGVMSAYELAFDSIKAGQLNLSNPFAQRLAERAGEGNVHFLIQWLYQGLNQALVEEYSDAMAGKLLPLARKMKNQALESELEALMKKGKEEKSKNAFTPFKALGKLFGKKE